MASPSPWRSTIGSSISVYFQDPEGNMVKVYWATGRKDSDRPYADPITLDDLD